MKGYTTAEHVEAQLGRSLSDSQKVYLSDFVLPAVEGWIDKNSGRTYGEQPVTAEPLQLNSGPYVWLSKTPVLSIQAVRGYYTIQTPADIAVVNPLWYRLMDRNTGYVRFLYWQAFAYMEADYTPDPAVPDRVRLAATMVAGVFMRTVLHPQSEWLTDYASGTDVRIKMRDIVIPDIVYTLLDESSSSGIVVA